MNWPPEFRRRASLAGPALALLLSPLAAALFLFVPSPGRAADTPDTRRQLAVGVDMARTRYGVDVGAWIYHQGRGLIYARLPDRPMPAASAVKSFVALDLLTQRRDNLKDPYPEPGGALSHEAFEGFSAEGLEQARRLLPGKTYWELAQIMMGHGGYPVEVYNAACNLLILDLGGPAAVTRRLRRLAPEFEGLDLNRYMEQWHANGDNMVTPRALGNLYLLLSRESIPGAAPEDYAGLRALLLREGEGPDIVYEKSGTLYPRPMARVRAGFLDRENADLVYSLMGIMAHPGTLELPDAFVLLLASMDTLTTIVKEVF